MWTQILMRVLWPAFIAACLLELVVFAVVDPQDLHWLGQAVTLSRQTVYSLSFFVFWAICTGSAALTALLATPPIKIEICGLTAETRPQGCPQQ